MKATRLVRVLAWATVAVGIASPAGGQAKAPARPERPAPAVTAPPAATSVPVYKPPLRGAPGGRIGGGTRGTGREVFVLSVLAPDDRALTLSPQASLYWFISRDTSLPLELTVTDPRTTQPILETRLPSPVAAGMHRVRLGDHEVRLEPGVPYRWFVAVVADQGRRSRDILAGASIELVEPSDELRSRLAATPADRLPFVLAEAGFWYDALEAISEAIERTPADTSIRAQRQALLGQVGLQGLTER